MDGAVDDGVGSAKGGWAPRALVVEDVAAEAAVVRAWLTHDAFSVDVAASGGAAIEALRRAPPDLVVLDLLLPDLHGIEVLRQARAERRTADVPVMVLTAVDEADVRAAATGAGADVFLLKPADGDTLRACARALAQRAQLRHALAEAAALRDELTLARQWACFVAHDVRNGLAATRTNLEFVRGRLAPTAAGDLDLALAEAIDECRRMDHATRDLADAGRLRDGQVTLQPAPVRLHELAAQASASLAGRAGVRELRIEGEAEALADRELIGRVLHNLVDNALKHARAGAVVIRVGPGSAAGARVEVSNAGASPLGALRARVMTPIAALVAASRDGHGLGLAFCKLALAAHGSVLSVEEPPDGGATFSFELPSPAR